jgi:hypothetical protein
MTRRRGVAGLTPLVRQAGETGFHADFTLSVTRALRDQLDAALNKLARASLSKENLDLLQERSGVYQLYLCGELIYVGKADTTLPGRLGQHMRKISGRENIDLVDVEFKSLYVAEDFTALAPEKLLISRYDKSRRLMWNHNGFGNKDPGRRRDHTAVKSNHFDRAYPADLHRAVKGLTPGSIRMDSFLGQLKSGLSFNFRFDKNLGAAADTLLNVENNEMTADQAFSLIASSMPPRWQIVALPGYSIMYSDSPSAYLSARLYYRGPDRIPAEPQFSPAGRIKEAEEETDIDEE